MNKICVICGSVINLELDVYLAISVIQHNGFNDGEIHDEVCICNQCPSEALTTVNIEKGNLTVHSAQIDPNEVR